MMFQFSKRLLTQVDKRQLWKMAYIFGWKGTQAIWQFKRRLKKGVYFPPFLHISITNSCNLHCQGCWVDVAGPTKRIEADDLNRIINEAKKYGNRFFGILGGEPFMHPRLLQVLAQHRDCYFQVFTNGHLITDEIAKELRRIGNTTPLISIEGSSKVSDERRGRGNVLAKTLEGLDHCVRHRLFTGVATSVCRSNIDDLVTEAWLGELSEYGVHYVWYYIYRPIGPKPSPELALSPEQIQRVREFIVKVRRKAPLLVIDAYWDDKGQAICPMATGISHHIGPYGDIEPCPIIQFARESIYDYKSLYEALTQSEFIKDFRKTAAKHTRGCILLERPDIVRDLVNKHGARDTSGRMRGLQELEAMQPCHSQFHPDAGIPEEQWMYRIAKKNWFFGFGAYN